ncbi:hypothetical protein [Natronobiforma cellulositropha]|uniref:hypothetical protein n=1 Tax=Natronobiforma cellulositropha TaxID=1679076 RepID=UPI0021D60A25|nr:hypothetical protein [Natronobiforma cellulositropha]
MSLDSVLVVNTILDEIVEMNEYFADVALGDGLAPVLIAMGTLLIVFSVGVFGLLTLGAAGSLFSFD